MERQDAKTPSSELWLSDLVHRGVRVAPTQWVDENRGRGGALRASVWIDVLRARMPAAAIGRAQL